VTGPPQVVVQSPVRQWPEASPLHPVRPQMRPPHAFATVSEVLCPGASLRPSGYAAELVTTAQIVSWVRLTRVMLRWPGGADCCAGAFVVVPAPVVEADAVGVLLRPGATFPPAALLPGDAETPAVGVAAPARPLPAGAPGEPVLVAFGPAADVSAAGSPPGDASQATPSTATTARAAAPVHIPEDRARCRRLRVLSCLMVRRPAVLPRDNRNARGPVAAARGPPRPDRVGKTLSEPTGAAGRPASHGRGIGHRSDGGRSTRLIAPA
jgi:hypothetical protein